MYCGSLQTWLLITFVGTIAAEGNDYRLPVGLYPIRYEIKILAHLDGPNSFRFTGQVRTLIKCESATKNIVLHSKDLKILENETAIRENGTTKYLPIGRQHAGDHDLYSIELEPGKMLQPNTEYILKMKFEGVITDGLAGFYRSSYIDSTTNKRRWLGVTQFEPTYARRAFPCFDEPEMKAVFSVTLGHHKEYRALSNMPLLKKINMADNESVIWSKFQDTVPMSTYLLAWVIADFDYEDSHTTARSEDGKTVLFRTWARKDALDQVRFAKEVGPRALDFYQKYFDIKYPLPKQDMVAIPDFAAGAMENWGLVTYRETALLYSPKKSSKRNKQRIATVVAHELAHQWFGNLVTMRWWTDLWLNEGFATYMASIALDKLFPEWNSLREDAVSNLLSVYSLDSLKSSHPISVPIGNPSEISQIFDTISYQKGSFILRMMSLFLGSEVLRKGVSNYLKKHAFSNAEQDDLWSSLTAQAHSDKALPAGLSVKEIMNTWTLQTGYPLVTITRDCEAQNALVTQQRYLKDKSDMDKYKNDCWWVPLSYTTEAEKDFKTTIPKQWLSCNRRNVTIPMSCDGWFVANIQATGLYKVNYDPENWQLIINTLNSDKYKDIGTINRVLLIDNAMDLAKTGHLRYQLAFQLLSYVQREDSYLPWKTALLHIGDLKRRLKRTDHYGMFLKYAKNLLEKIYGSLGELGDVGSSSSESSSEETELLELVNFKTMIVAAACEYDVGSCQEDAVKHLRNWMDMATASGSLEDNPIPQDFRSTVYCYGVKKGGEQEWAFLWKQYNISNVGSEKNTILVALSCTKEPWLLKRYLEWSINDKTGIRKQDTHTVFSTVADNDIGYFLAKDFLESQLKAIHECILPNESRIGRYTSSLASQMTTEYEQTEFMKLLAENRNYFTKAKLVIEQNLETINVNIQWYKKHRSVIEQVLKRHLA